METDVGVAAKGAEWAEHLSRQAASGMTVAAYCRAQGLKAHQFLYRRQRQRRVGTASGGGFVQLQAPAPTGSVRAEHRSGWRLYVERGTDEATLTKAARALART